MAAMTGAAMASAIGIVRRGRWISPPMNAIASGPVHAKAITDQKIRSLICTPGRSAATLRCVAEPNLHQAIAPSVISISVALQRATPPAFVSHLPICKP
jgi:hypothetical protein